MCELVRPRSAPLSKVYPGAISSWFSLNRRLVRMTPDIREECDESLRHDRVHDDRVAQGPVLLLRRQEEVPRLRRPLGGFARDGGMFVVGSGQPAITPSRPTMVVRCMTRRSAGSCGVTA